MRCDPLPGGPPRSKHHLSLPHVPKAFSSFFGPLVTCHDVEWTRGEPKRFRSSSKARRGFCAECETPLTYEQIGSEAIELAIGAFDDPRVAAPTLQLNPRDKLPFFDTLPRLRTRLPDENPEQEAFKRAVVSYQHPDHDAE